MIFRDRSGNIIATTDQLGPKILIRDPSNNILGSYDPRDNTTRDPSDNRIGTGNLLTMLIPKPR